MAAGTLPLVTSIGDIRNSFWLGYSDWRKIHSSLGTYRFEDPSGSYDADAFSRTAYKYAQKLDSSQIPASDAVKRATQSTYETMIAALASFQLVTAVSPAIQFRGSFVSSSTRLYVVDPIAYAFIGLLSLVLVCTVCMLYQSYTSKSILTEDPVGLLGKAILLFRSELFDLIEVFYQNHNAARQGLVKEVTNDESANDSSCWYEWDGSNAGGFIRYKELGFAAPRTRLRDKLRDFVRTCYFALVGWLRWPFTKVREVWQRITA